MNDRTNITILLVEDNPDHSELITDSLEEENVVNKVLSMDNGTEALKYIRGEGKYQDCDKYPKPGLILLDIKLPDMSGKDILKVIKSNENWSTIPTIMLTSSSRDLDINECYKFGANSYVEKPMSFSDFSEKVKKIPLYWALTNKLPTNVQC